MISIFINLMQMLYYRYKYNRMENIHLKKEKRLLEKSLKVSEELIALKCRIKFKEIK